VRSAATTNAAHGRGSKLQLLVARSPWRDCGDGSGLPQKDAPRRRNSRGTSCRGRRWRSRDVMVSVIEIVIGPGSRAPDRPRAQTGATPAQTWVERHPQSSVSWCRRVCVGAGRGWIGMQSRVHRRRTRMDRHAGARAPAPSGGAWARGRGGARPAEGEDGVHVTWHGNAPKFAV
jgi:hypothetical protein